MARNGIPRREQALAEASTVRMADRITVCLRQKVRELSPECRVVMTGLKKAEATVGQAPRNAEHRE